MVDTSAEDPAQLYYSSGTTGLAKGILHAHRYILAHEEFEFCHDVQDGELFHGMGEWAWAAGIAPLLGPWRYGATALVYARKGGFDPDEQLRFLAKHGVQGMFTTPTALRAMTAIEDAGERYPLPELRNVCSAGEPLNPEVIRWFRDQYGLTVLDYYGLTESYPLCGNFPHLEVREGSMGRVMPGWEVAILDEDEQPVPTGERGEICLKARSNPHYPLGYWNRPEDTEADFGGDWFHTKDAAQMDEDGYVWYAGRADDVIISAGYRIGPFEVESACVEHPAVKEAAAVASPDAKRGDIVKAFIVLAAGHEAHRRDRRRHQAVRARPPLGLRLPARDRVRRRPAEDPHRQDPPDRAARGGARGKKAADGLRLREPAPAGCRRAPPRPRTRPARAAPITPVIAFWRGVAFSARWAGVVGPHDRLLEDALGAVELQRQEAQPDQDHQDPGAGDARARHHDPEQHQQHADDHHADPAHDPGALVALLALLQLAQQVGHVLGVRAAVGPEVVVLLLCGALGHAGRIVAYAAGASGAGGAGGAAGAAGLPARIVSRMLAISVNSPMPMKPTKPIGVRVTTASKMATQPSHLGSAPAPRTTDSPVARRKMNVPSAIGKKSFSNRALSVRVVPPPTSSAVSAIVNTIVASIAPPIAMVARRPWPSRAGSPSPGRDP